jgi:hypothetical protein
LQPITLAVFRSIMSLQKSALRPLIITHGRVGVYNGGQDVVVSRAFA